MLDILGSNIATWLRIEQADGPGRYQLSFDDRHIGNPWLRSVHGGVSASMIEICAEAETRKAVGPDVPLTVSTSTVDYLRVTTDVNVHAEAVIARQSKRLSIVDVICWQNDEEKPVARGSVTIKIG